MMVATKPGSPGRARNKPLKPFPAPSSFERREIMTQNSRGLRGEIAEVCFFGEAHLFYPLPLVGRVACGERSERLAVGGLTRLFIIGYPPPRLALLADPPHK